MSKSLNVLIVGQGGREHTLAWKIAQSPQVVKVWVAPGNGGAESNGSDAGVIANVPLSESDFEGLIDFAQQSSVGLTVIGPESPLADGIVDAFQQAGLRCFGPKQKAAQLEASKAFAKDFMVRHHIPTGRHAVFTKYDEAIAHLQHVDYDVVVKASGLAAGKGVIVPDSLAEAEAALQQIMTDRAFGAAGDEVVIEERLYGQEASILAFCDGHTIVPTPVSQDHKQVFEGDTGPNTGGMGAYAPASLVNPVLQQEIMDTVLKPTLAGLQAEGIPFLGIIYAGLMITKDGPRILEYNCRFGDPETQVVLPLLESDLTTIFEACIDGTLDQLDIRWRSDTAATVVMASEGYPGSYPKGREITGIAAAEALSETTVFHAGTRKDENNQLVTSGGRVLAVTGLGIHLQQALDRAYAGIEQINFQGMHFRRDIGAKALADNENENEECRS